MPQLFFCRCVTFFGQRLGRSGAGSLGGGTGTVEVSTVDGIVTAASDDAKGAILYGLTTGMRNERQDDTNEAHMGNDEEGENKDTWPTLTAEWMTNTSNSFPPPSLSESVLPARPVFVGPGSKVGKK